MTIQVSVLLWAIISFLCAMLILKRFLFKPMLSMLDARKKRLEDAARMKAEMDEAEQAASKKLEGAAAEEPEEALRERDRENALLAAAEEKAKEHQDEVLSAWRSELAAQRPALEEGLRAEIDPLAKAIAEKILA